jgi:hypothetical protein
MTMCKHPGCQFRVSANNDYCEKHALELVTGKVPEPKRASDMSMSQRYPKYYKRIPEGMESIDVYGVHHLFQIQDPAGMLQHASKKLLLSGVRTGGKSFYDDVKEARDILNRWLELNPEPEVKIEVRYG